METNQYKKFNQKACLQYKCQHSSRWKNYYQQVINSDIIIRFHLNNGMEIPRILKITLNYSSKRVVQEKKEILPALIALELITGQKCKTTWSRKSIAAFKLREKTLLGCKVTLRGEIMYSFLEKLVTVVLPRDRYFQQLQTGQGISQPYFDSHGNYNIGINNPFLFTELESDFEFFQLLRGINITIVTSTTSKEKASFLLKGMQLPISDIKENH